MVVVPMLSSTSGIALAVCCIPCPDLAQSAISNLDGSHGVCMAMQLIQESDYRDLSNQTATDQPI